jgi:predicted nucleotide-binding protein
MSKKANTIEEPRKACLIMPADKFQSALENRIVLGKELLNIKVTRNTTPYGLSGYAGFGFVSQEERQYNKQEIEAFKKEYQKWTGYNSELLKQAFDIPENEYKREYDGAGEKLLVGHEDVMEEYYKKINRKIAALERLIDQLPLLPKSNVLNTPLDKKPDVSKSKKVFIVHGHDNNTRNEVELLVSQLGFDPVILFKKPNMGDTIIEKLFRESSDVAFAIVLYTRCDEGKAVEESDLKPRARQNVVFEHGLMCGLLGRKRVVALVEEGVEIPGDLSGVVYITLDDAKRWQFDVAREMKATGLPVDLNKLF